MEKNIHIFLPIGSIVTLKKSTKKIMVTGTLVSLDGKNIYTYSGCLWPEGIVDTNSNIVFNIDDIRDVIYKAPSDFKEFSNYIENGDLNGSSK